MIPNISDLQYLFRQVQTLKKERQIITKIHPMDYWMIFPYRFLEMNNSYVTKPNSFMLIPCQVIFKNGSKYFKPHEKIKHFNWQTRKVNVCISWSWLRPLTWFRKKRKKIKWLVCNKCNTPLKSFLMKRFFMFCFF